MTVRPTSETGRDGAGCRRWDAVTSIPAARDADPDVTGAMPSHRDAPLSSRAPDATGTTATRRKSGAASCAAATVTQMAAETVTAARNRPRTPHRIAAHRTRAPGTNACPERSGGSRAPAPRPPPRASSREPIPCPRRSARTHSASIQHVPPQVNPEMPAASDSDEHQLAVVVDPRDRDVEAVDLVEQPRSDRAHGNSESRYSPYPDFTSGSASARSCAGVDEPLAVGDLLGRADLQPLALLDHAHELGRLHQRLEGAGVQPRRPPVQHADLQLPLPAGTRG